MNKTSLAHPVVSQKRRDKAAPRTLYLLYSVRESPDGTEDVQLIGVYSSRAKAVAGRTRLQDRTRFLRGRRLPIGKADLDRDYWVEGYVTEPARHSRVGAR